MFFCSSVLLSLAAVQAEVIVPVTLPLCTHQLLCRQLSSRAKAGPGPLPAQASTAALHAVATECHQNRHT